MADLDSGNHPILNIVLMVVAVVTGAKGLHNNFTAEELDYYDKILAIFLKGVSILSFLLIIALNLNKLVVKIRTFFKDKKDA